MSSRAHFSFPPANRRGSILVVALWMIAIIGAFALSSGYQARQKVSLADRIDSKNWLGGLAESGIYQGIWQIKQRKENAPEYHAFNDPYTSNTSFYKRKFLGEGSYTISYEYTDPDDDTVKIRYGLQDEEQKINVNGVKPEVISRLIQMVGEKDRDSADQIAYSIEDWRDENNAAAHPEFGAEDDYYEDLDAPYDCKDFTLESLDELLLVRGMTPELFEKLKPYITVFGSGAVNINTAPKQVFLALGMDSSLIDKIFHYRNGPDREQGTEDDRSFMNLTSIADQLNQVESISSSDVSLISQLVTEDQLGIASSFFMIHSRGEVIKKKQIQDIVAVVDQEGKIHYWQSSGIPRRMTPTEIKNIDAN